MSKKNKVVNSYEEIQDDKLEDVLSVAEYKKGKDNNSKFKVEVHGDNWGSFDCEKFSKTYENAINNFINDSDKQIEELKKVLPDYDIMCSHNVIDKNVMSIRFGKGHFFKAFSKQ